MAELNALPITDDQIEDMPGPIQSVDYAVARTVYDMGNPFLRAVGSMTPSSVASEDELRTAGQQMVDKYTELKAAAEARDVTDVSLWDLTNIDVLGDDSIITDADAEMISFSVQLRKIVQGLHALGISFTNDDFVNVSLLTNAVIEIPIKTAGCLYDNFMGSLQDPTFDEDIGEILINACADLINERASFDVYLNEVFHMDMTTASDDEVASMHASYMDEYLDWKHDEAVRIISELIKSPLNTVMILPKGFEELKEVLETNLPVEAHEFISTLTPSSVFKGEVWETLMKSYGQVSRESSMAMMSAIDKFVKDNGVMSVPMGNGEALPLLYTVSLPEVLLHTLLLASAELFEDKPDEELSYNTQYVVDTVRFCISQNDLISELASSETVYKILSTLSQIVPLMTARSTAIKGASREYHTATGSIQEVILKDMTDDISREELNRGEDNE